MLAIPTVPNPFDPANPIVNAVGVISSIHLDVSGSSGYLVLNIHPNAAAVGKAPPLTTVRVNLGQGLVPANPSANPPTAAISFPTLAELMADSAFAAAYAAVGARLYADLVATVPLLAKAVNGSGS